MITVLHGDDIAKSRNEIARIKIEFLNHEFYRFEGTKTTQTDIIQVFEAQSLFESPKLILLEGFVQTKNKGLMASVFNHLKRDIEHEVIFWEPKEIKKELLAFFPRQTKIQNFKIDRAIFQFLDAIRPNNVKQLLFLFHTILEHDDAEFVFFMMIRQFRLLLALSDTKSEKQIDELKRMAPWQKNKVGKQAQYFSQKRLVELYQKLFQIEMGLKTSSLPMSVTQMLDLFLVSL